MDNEIDPQAAFNAAVARYRMFETGQTVLVGVSGGPDSVALLHMLAQLAVGMRLSLAVAHLNHRIRGADADADAQFVTDLATRMCLPHVVESVDVPALRRRLHLSEEEAAREARHAFLRRAAAQFGADRIALGHTADDRIETVLLNLVRGTGPEGLAGFAAVDLPIVRPLYEMRRGQTTAYCAEKNLCPRLDASNQNTDYRRNRIRAELLPHLASYYNSGVDRAILRLSDLVAEESSTLDTLAAAAFDRCLWAEDEASVALDVLAFGSLEPALARRVARKAIARIRCDLRDISFEAVGRLLSAVALGRTATFQLPSAGVESVFVECRAGTFRVFKTGAAAAELPWDVELTVPGKTELPNAGLTIDAVRALSGHEAREILKRRIQHAGAGLVGANGTAEYVVVLDGTCLHEPLRARSWRAGDRMRPRGLCGGKKLQDVFTDAKVARSDRGRTPVIVDAAGRILAAGGVRVDETALLSRRGGPLPEEGKLPSGETLLLFVEACSRP